MIATADENLDVWRAAIKTYFASLACDHGERAAMPEQRALDEWFWEPFRQPSVVVRAFDPYRPRDEDAVIELSAHLSKPVYPHVEHLRIDLENPRWGEVLHPKKVNAICVVGRPGMYGADVLSTVDPPEPKTLDFYYPVQIRPKDLQLGSIDQRFHQICRRLPGRIDDERYVSKSDGRERIDYGLVQRYAVTYNTRRVVVVICAGCSTLGTMAAVRWATNLGEGPIGPIDNVDTYEPCEALLSVKADETKFPANWSLKTIRLLTLTVGNREWVAENNCWCQRAPCEITIARNERKQPQSILFDGQKARLHTGSQPFDLLVAICDLADQAAGNTVLFTDVLKHPLICPARQDHVRNRRVNMGRLKNRLGTAISEDGDTIHLRTVVQWSKSDV
jgi:hypothetical protein